ncbi:MAG: 3-deoxy-manno-octulosonate cytidylyltransferase [Nitrospinota bacterium]
MHTKKVVGVIPARYASTRFPGKLLEKIGTKTILQRVWEQCKKSSSLSHVVVATDSEIIEREVRSFNGEVVMTSPTHQSGTDRVSEAAEKIDAEIIVNIQGDEPLIQPNVINQAVSPFFTDESLMIGTVASQIRNKEELDNTNIVKVLIDRHGFAIYFSRLAIPFFRNDSQASELSVIRYKHIGLYVYRKEFLLSFSKMLPSALEKAEKLEQLRAIENGYRIRVEKVNYDAFGVDTPEDLKKIKARFE